MLREFSHFASNFVTCSRRLAAVATMIFSGDERFLEKNCQGLSGSYQSANKTSATVPVSVQTPRFSVLNAVRV